MSNGIVQALFDLKDHLPAIVNRIGAWWRGTRPTDRESHNGK